MSLGDVLLMCLQPDPLGFPPDIDLRNFLIVNPNKQTDVVKRLHRYACWLLLVLLKPLEVIAQEIMAITLLLLVYGLTTLIVQWGSWDFHC
jgi:hypothetical protein